MPCDQVNLTEFEIQGVPFDIQKEALVRLGYSLYSERAGNVTFTGNGRTVRLDGTSVVVEERYGEFDTAQFRQMAARITVERQAKRMGWTLSEIMGGPQKAMATLNQLRRR